MAKTSHEFTIRQFIFPEDYEGVVRVWETSGPGIHMSPSDQPSEIRKKLLRDPELFLVAEKDHQIVGTVIGGYDGRRGMMYHLAVDPICRRMGIATALLKELEVRLKKLGCIKCYLLVVPENYDAINFYAQNGWQQMQLSIFGKEL